MTPSEELLQRLENDEDLAYELMLFGDFDITRRDPVEELALANGLPLEAIAGDGGGGTYFLVGDPEAAERPVLYTDSEGGAVLMAANLVEAIELIAHFPYWEDVPFGHDPAELEEEYRHDREGFDADRAELVAALGLGPLSLDDALARLRAAVARYEPGYVPTCVTHDGGPYHHAFYNRTF